MSRDKDKIKTQNKAWREANKEHIKRYDRAYYAANRERAKVWCEAYRKANPEKKRLSDKAYRKANPEKGRESSRKHRALKQTTQVEPIKEKEIYLRDGWTCQICHKKVHNKLKFPNPMSASLDHIIPLSEGGTHTYDNVQLAHLGCNISKQNNVLPQGEQTRLF